jgi:hypothetical protein
MNALYQIQALGLELAIIPPLFPSTGPDCVIGESFSSLAEHRVAVSEVQRFRGRVYVEDGAIPTSALDEEGRHYQEFDFENYHLCLRDLDRRIRACFRLRLHDPAVEIRDLKLHEVIERMPSGRAVLCYGALADLFELSRQEQVRIGEVGGWAVDEELRCHRGSTVLPFAAWSLYQIVGNALVVASATSRHHSSAILKRIGGFALKHGDAQLPCFMDEFHGCEIELLGFDSRRPNAKYEKLVTELKSYLLTRARGISTPQCDREIEEEAYA